MKEAALPALAMLLCIGTIPRLAQDFRGLMWVVLAGFVLAGIGYAAIALGWASRQPEWLLLPLLLAVVAFATGVIARAVVLMGQRRNWPPVADAVITTCAAGFLVYGFFSIFAGV